ncbi:MAG: DNA mismatch repair endonuclease MutL [Desulfobulbaceae bacterium]|nr:DNA mismatch repair endonuclease MutL [Desulfobulbaceae bacterium]
MSRIRILSEHLANQIAAGEVVERPASVVKELVENSLDAGATRLSVQIEGSGTRLIRVVDNGEGMDEDDVLLSIERHATSKLNDNSRLDAINTLGFRGEALPSIGSVSRLTLLSRPQQKETGTRAEIRYGTLHAVHEDGCAKGTIVEVRGLFGNVPARRKFLKSARTELYHIEEVLRNQSLAHMQTGFLLQVDQRPVLDLLPVEAPEQRIRDVFRYRGKFIAVDSLSGDEVPICIKGFLLQPEVSSSKTNKLRTLVNGRPVQDKMVRHAVVEGLHGFLMKGQSPSGVLFLDLPAEQIDVNVHPAKQEIRFRRSQDVHRAIVRAVSKALRAYQEQMRSDIFTLPVTSPDRKEEPSLSTGEAEVRSSSAASPRPVTEDAFLRSVNHPVGQSPQAAEPVPEFHVPPFSSPVTHRGQDEGLADFSGLTLVGQLFNLYLLCERDEQLVVIDQHAAHERILYQQLRSAYQERDIPRQNLMFPAPVEVTLEQAETLEKYGEDIAALGFTLQHFGEETWVIKSVPALVGHLDPAELLLDTLDRTASVSDKKSTGIAARVDALLSSMACKAAVKAGDRLAPEEMLELLVQMQASEYFSHCPHGRPVVRVFSEQDIAKWFHRG